jgi:hypothetical protein
MRPIKNETEEMVKAYEYYLSLGLSRHIRLVAEYIGKSQRTMQHWRQALKWEERVDKYLKEHGRFPNGDMPAGVPEFNYEPFNVDEYIDKILINKPPSEENNHNIPIVEKDLHFSSPHIVENSSEEDVVEVVKVEADSGPNPTLDPTLDSGFVIPEIWRDKPENKNMEIEIKSEEIEVCSDIKACSDIKEIEPESDQLQPIQVPLPDRYTTINPEELFDDCDMNVLPEMDINEDSPVMMVRSKMDYRRIIGVMIQTFIRDFNSGRIKITSIYEFEKLVKLDLLLMGESTGRIDTNHFYDVKIEQTLNENPNVQKLMAELWREENGLEQPDSTKSNLPDTFSR